MITTHCFNVSPNLELSTIDYNGNVTSNNDARFFFLHTGPAARKLLAFGCGAAMGLVCYARLLHLFGVYPLTLISTLTCFVSQF